MVAGSGSTRARTALGYLRRRITGGDWPVNSRIPTETELMGILGVGRTTVREAVRSLASVGMLETLPGRGTFVRARTPASSMLTDYLADVELADVLTLRRALEVEAAGQAAIHRSEDQFAALRAAHRTTTRDVDYPTRPERGHGQLPFHAALFEASGSTLLPALYGGVMASLRRAIDRGQVVYADSAERRRLDHETILAAIEAQDAVAAAREMSTHVDHDLRLRRPDEATPPARRRRAASVSAPS
ncbi:MAG: GntR family transcriptional regulator [Microbacterium sp.]